MLSSVCLLLAVMQALAGQVEEGVALHKNWSAAWKRFGWLPEMFDLSMDNRHPTETGASEGCKAAQHSRSYFGGRRLF